MNNFSNRIIGAAHAMPKHVLEIVWNEIRTLQPISERITNDEIAASAILEVHNYTEDDKREQVIGAATVMNIGDASRIWNTILEIINIPESTEEELAQAIEESLSRDNKNVENY